MGSKTTLNVLGEVWTWSVLYVVVIVCACRAEAGGALCRWQGSPVPVHWRGWGAALPTEDAVTATAGVRVCACNPFLRWCSCVWSAIASVECGVVLGRTYHNTLRIC